MRLCDKSVWSSFDWVRNTLQPKGRKQDSEEEIKQAREVAKESGTANVFEYDDIAPTTEVTQKSKPAKVCMISLSYDNKAHHTAMKMYEARLSNADTPYFPPQAEQTRKSDRRQAD